MKDGEAGATLRREKFRLWEITVVREQTASLCLLPGPHLLSKGRKGETSAPGHWESPGQAVPPPRGQREAVPHRWSDTQTLMLFHLCRALHRDPYFIANKHVIFLIQRRVQQSMHIIQHVLLKTRAWQEVTSSLRRRERGQTRSRGFLMKSLVNRGSVFRKDLPVSLICHVI